MVKEFLEELDKFSIEPSNNKNKEEIISELKELVINSIEKRIPRGKFGVLFSGGVDSTLIAFICKKLGKNFKCYVAGLEDKNLEEAKDVVQAQKIAEELGFELEIIKVNLEDTQKYLKEVLQIIKTNNVTKAGVGLPIYICSKKAKADGIKVLFSGLGSEEIFAGYERHKKSEDINKECLEGLKNIYERDLKRDLAIAHELGVKFAIPFLDIDLIAYGLKIPAKFKIKDEFSKYILREVAVELGLKKEFSFRKKIAAQYGSNFDKAISKLATRNGFRYKLGYLNSLYNVPLGVLCSTGKDSWFAALKMHENKFDLKCLINVQSKNKDSFMFHTPNINMIELQSEASNLPCIIGETEGIEEEELKDLKGVLIKAVKKFKIKGICTGALYSKYQKSRIEKICSEIGLEVYNPLWHMDQEEELRELIKNKFEVIISSIACDGLDEKWLGRKLDEKMLENLIRLNKEIGINVAGEGGEFESLVLNCPLFSKKIEIEEAEKIMKKEYTGSFLVKEAKLK